MALFFVIVKFLSLEEILSMSSRGAMKGHHITSANGLQVE